MKNPVHKKYFRAPKFPVHSKSLRTSDRNLLSWFIIEFQCFFLVRFLSIHNLKIYRFEPAELMGHVQDVSNAYESWSIFCLISLDRRTFGRTIVHKLIISCWCFPVRQRFLCLRSCRWEYLEIESVSNLSCLMCEGEKAKLPLRDSEGLKHRSSSTIHDSACPAKSAITPNEKPTFIMWNH